MRLSPPALRLMRRQVDLVDLAMRRLLRLRQGLVGALGRRKRAQGWPLQDPDREAAMQTEAERDARALGLPPAAGGDLLALSLSYCRPALHGDAGQASPDTPAEGLAWLRWLPPPARLAPLLRRLPAAPLQHGSRRLFSAALADALTQGELDPLRGRRLAIEASDLGLRWVVQVGEGTIDVLDDASPAEASIRGSAVDLLQLASRNEDADTLFFQRRLQLTGDVELGLTARNLLDRLPWEKVPLALRILLQRATRIAVAARRAHQQARTRVPDARIAEPGGEAAVAARAVNPR